ncbi:MAG: hypothetical protein IPF92_22200 [Myxococcales bacterium]|nr:hypothetical protein [Myxococcales bacterium]MBL0194552.1 hypothetical protein [Myxococcales bacterium]HQY64563.1 hypothetical protein [Polyangiaceae bacterium]
MAELARTLDRQALDLDPGPRVRIELAVPPDWARDGATVRVHAPARAVCARCDGGGCDGCERAGAFRLGASPDERAFDLTLPRGLSAEGVELRVSTPFGHGSPITQVLCRVRVCSVGEGPRGCARVDVAVPGGTTQWPSGARGRAFRHVACAVLAAVALAVTWLAAHGPHPR